MSERLQRFRKLMAAFEGSSNPQHAIERGYYVDLPNNPMAGIARRVELRPSSVHLLLGGIGSGKTTQLLLAQEHLNQLEDFNAIYVDVSLHTDISELKQGSLVAIAGLEIIKLLDKINDLELDGDQEIIKAKTTIKKFAHGYREKREVDNPHYIGNLHKTSLLGDIHSPTRTEVFYDQGLLKKKEKKQSELIKSFILLAKIVFQYRGEITFVFDGLDRLNDTNIFINRILNDVNSLSESGICLFIVGSILVAHIKEIENFANYLYYFSYLDTSENIEAQRFFMNILNLRDSDNSITSEAKEFLVIFSGGVLRDLMSLTQSAIEEAYVDGSDDVKLEHAEQAIASLSRSKFMGLTDANLETLQKVISQKTFIPRTPEELELLLTGHILEYSRHPRKYFAVHPVLVPLIQGIQEENKNLSVAHG